MWACTEPAEEDEPAEPVAAVEEQVVLVSVTASSEPPGAVVTGGGRTLGRTPLVTQVPAPRTNEPARYQFTFQLPGYNPETVEATPSNNTISVDAVLTPVRGAAVDSEEIVPEVASPASTRTLAEIVDEYQPSDASDRFVWAASTADARAQLLCGDRAIEAARRASQRFRHEVCRGVECELTNPGNADPRLYAERTPDGIRLIGYWNALAGDASRERIEQWRDELECDEVVEF